MCGADSGDPGVHCHDGKRDVDAVAHSSRSISGPVGDVADTRPHWDQPYWEGQGAPREGMAHDGHYTMLAQAGTSVRERETTVRDFDARVRATYRPCAER